MWVSNEQEKENSVRGVDERGRLPCPMCRGRGYFDPTQPISQTSHNEVGNTTATGLKLPKLETKTDTKGAPKPCNKFSLPSIRNVKNLPEAGTTEKSANSRTQTVVQTIKDRKATAEKPRFMSRNKVEARLSTSSSRTPSEVSSIDSDPDRHLIPSPEPPVNPQETFKNGLARLKSSEWSETIQALKDIVQVSRYHPHILEGSLILVYRAVTAMLKSLRSTVIRIACQAANDLFSNLYSTQRPEFDELINALLQKTGDMNKCIRRDANEALDSMTVHVPYFHSVRTIVQRGIPHKNPHVRTAASRLLVCVVGITGTEAIYGGNKETRGRIMSAAAQSLQDGCQDVRSYGRRLIKMLMQHENFDEVLESEVSSVLLKRIDKTLLTIKYQG